MKIRPLGAELFYADRRTDMKLIAALRNFANVLQNAMLNPQWLIHFLSGFAV